MRHRMPLMCTLALLAGLVGCKTTPQQEAKKETPAKAVALTDLPAPVRATIERLTAGGTIRSLEQEETGGRTLYDVEATVAGNDVEYDVAGDGTVLTSQMSIPYSSLPRPVQARVGRYFGSVQNLTASKELDGGQVLYEVEGKRRGIPVTVKLTDAGRIVEVEKE